VTTLSDLADEVQDFLEEPNGPGIFWSRAAEIYPTLVEALNEAALITGEPEIRQGVPFTFPETTTVIQLPPNAIALLRVQAPQWIPKTTIWDLDRMVPGWEADSGQTIDSWFPLGLTQFGIHPQLEGTVQGYLTYVALPVSTGRPYTGAEVVPFQAEFEEGFADYAGHVLQLKEAGQEFVQSAKMYDRFLSKMVELSNFSWRKGSLRFTRTVGSASRLNPLESR
jgi:hypothetical protein